MSNGRYDYIDIAKGLGILCVVWAHILVTGSSHRLIYAFHMPLFFLLSGMLFSPEKYPSFVSFVIRRSKRLLIPYVAYSVITWCLWVAFRCLRHDAVDSYLMPLLQTFIAQGSGAFLIHNSALWFIPCLFLVEILYFFISKLGRWWCLIVCFACSILSFILGALFKESYWLMLPWNADAALIALPFYCIGNDWAMLLGHKRAVRLANEKCSLFVLVGVILFIILYWSSTRFGECSMGSSSYGCQPWVFMLRAFVGCAFAVCLSLVLSVEKISTRDHLVIINYLKWAGINSLDIMCLHIPVKGICMIGVAFLLHTTV